MGKQVAIIVFFMLATATLSIGETADEAVKRIRSGRHSAMPPPVSRAATGPAGKGMTVENGTGHTVVIHFNGPVTRSVSVPNGLSSDVELVTGDYEVAAEVPGSRIVPFYGRQSYAPNTHYWLKFFVRTR
jgi:hypothetical protein